MMASVFMKMISADDKIYTEKSGLQVREITLNFGLGYETVIGYLSDLHLNFCNKQDFEEQNPVVMSTYKHRLWGANADFVPKLRMCLQYISNCDQIVINGDTLDYLSHGCMELMDREVWDKVPGVMATVGGHELAMCMQGTVRETFPLSERKKIIESYWRHNIYYYSKMLGDKIIIAGFYNNGGCADKYTYDMLSKDIKYARENDCIILLFAHEPIRTLNLEHKNFTADMLITKGDTGGFPYDFFAGGNLLGNENCDEISKAVYNLITTNADTVKAFFAGHFHNDIYLPINAKTVSGEMAVIPQYVTTSAVFDNGHTVKIIIK